MKIKVKFFDKNLLQELYAFICVISTFSCFSILFDNISSYKWWIVSGVFIIANIFHIVNWYKANCLKDTCINLNGSSVEISEGDIFNQEGLKVIAFNEYFDTNVDDKIISSKTLHGKFLKSLKDTEITKLRTKISKDETLKSKIVANKECLSGSKTRKAYKLGTVIEYNEYALTAFSHFDQDNKAYLTLSDYISCLLQLWSEIDRIYNGKIVNIPLLGAGMTRLKEAGDISNQEILETLLWTLKLSRIKLAYPAKFKIIIYPDIMDKVNLYRIKQLFKN